MAEDRKNIIIGEREGRKQADVVTILRTFNSYRPTLEVIFQFSGKISGHIVSRVGARKRNRLTFTPLPLFQRIDY